MLRFDVYVGTSEGDKTLSQIVNYTQVHNACKQEAAV